MTQQAGEIDWHGCPWIRMGTANVGEILTSGQVFHWHQVDDYWVGLIDQMPVVLRQVGKKLYLIEGETTVVKRYLGIGHEHSQLPPQLLEDPFIAKCYRIAHSVRLMQQPRWECFGDVYHFFHETS